jgi:hypothetical protein
MLRLSPLGDTAPRRIRLSRARGWRKPPNTVTVSRPTKWGNPFRSDLSREHAECVRLFETWLGQSPEGKDLAAAARRELRGKNLACWCALEGPCHADILLRLANLAP